MNMMRAFASAGINTKSELVGICRRNGKVVDTAAMLMFKGQIYYDSAICLHC